MMFSYELMIAFIYNVQEHMKTRNMGKIIFWPLNLTQLSFYGGQRTSELTIKKLEVQNSLKDIKLMIVCGFRFFPT